MGGTGRGRAKLSLGGRWPCTLMDLDETYGGGVQGRYDISLGLLWDVLLSG